MKRHPIHNIRCRRSGKVISELLRFGITTSCVAIFGFGMAVAAEEARDSDKDEQDGQVLTRGPVHEAFAGLVSYNPEPGVIVEKAPPQAINEMPPAERPAGDNITWIPGYWGWDDERTDYLWISGTWRALPPGRQWTTGYWASNGQAHQWTSGYWADSSVEETTYLPKPPMTAEAGPNVTAPSRDHRWTPGSWTWQQERYAWRPGYWTQGRSDWDWIPDNYVWTPRGYVFVNGYWDYSFNRRGTLYAPVYFRQGYHSRPGHSYSPVIAIGLVAMMEHLFLRPNYHHYYFGDYYDNRYRNHGYYSPYAYHSSRHGYDPVYSYRRWSHRQDADWEHRYVASYDYRRDHQSARPPRTWDEQKRLKSDNEVSRDHQLMIAASSDQIADRKDNPVRLEAVTEKERKQLSNRGQEVRKSSEERRELETHGDNNKIGKGKQEIKPSKVKRPASSIVGRSADRFEKQQAPPKPQRSPNTGSPSDQNKPEIKGKPESRGSDDGKDHSDRTKETPPRNKKQPEGTGPDKKMNHQTTPPRIKEPERDPKAEQDRTRKDDPIKPDEPSKKKDKENAAEKKPDSNDDQDTGNEK